jgi:hypothetical protein
MTSSGLHRATPPCGVTRATAAGVRQASVTRTWPTGTQRASGPSTADFRVSKRGFTRGGSTLCGVLGFQQHLGLWAALLGGVGWLIASDHAGYLLRRRYGPRMRARLSRWQPKGPAHNQLLASLHMLAGDSRRVAATSYPVFALLNAGNASLWGSTFVGGGYILAALWSSGRTSWSSVALVLASSAAILTVALTARHRRHAGTKTG